MFEPLALAAEAQGIACLRFHMRGHGDSEGALEEQGFEAQVADAAAALDFLSSLPDLDPTRIGLLGFSLGGAVAAVLSARRPMKALALWGSLLDTKNWSGSRFDRYGKPENGVVKIWDDIPVSEELFSQALTNDPLADALAYPGPLFAGHGLKDQNHPPEKSQELVLRRQEAGLKAEGFFPPRSGHTFKVSEDKELLMAKTLAFFKANL
jgi:dipeptidyl aminopeptidase/acylaminoacyl peptidase